MSLPGLEDEEGPVWLLIFIRISQALDIPGRLVTVDKGCPGLPHTRFPPLKGKIPEAVGTESRWEAQMVGVETLVLMREQAVPLMSSETGAGQLLWFGVTPE